MENESIIFQYDGIIENVTILQLQSCFILTLTDIIKNQIYIYNNFIIYKCRFLLCLSVIQQFYINFIK